MAGSNRRGGCLQFSVRTALILTGLSAASLGLAFSIPAEFEYVAFFLLMPAPVVFAIWAIYGRGYARTFAIGACIPAALLNLSSIHFSIFYSALDEAIEIDDSDPGQVRATLLAVFAVAMLIFLLHGALAVLVRWLVQPQDASDERRQHDERAECSPFDDEAAAK